MAIAALDSDVRAVLEWKLDEEQVGRGMRFKVYEKSHCSIRYHDRPCARSIGLR